jgi:hypothetical protein
MSSKDRDGFRLVIHRVMSLNLTGPPWLSDLRISLFPRKKTHARNGRRFTVNDRVTKQNNQQKM